MGDPSPEGQVDVLEERMRRLDGTRMPRLGTSEVHGAAIDLIGQWIDGL